MISKNSNSITLFFTILILVSAGILSSCDNEDPDIFPQPNVRRSFNGVLKTTLEALYAVNNIENTKTGEFDTINTPTYNDSLIGPTLLVKPGDTLEINLKNNLPPNPEIQRRGTGNAFPHNPFSTNFHTHGLTVSPLGISDNVLRVMDPGTENPIKIEIPEDHACGTFWYHPHKHGSVSFQFFGGMFGILIIDDEQCAINQVPEIEAAKDVVMGIGVIRTNAETGESPFVNMEAETFSQGGSTPPLPPSLWQFFQETNFYFTINGVVNPTLHMRPGEVQRWRILNAASGETVIPALEGHNMNVIAADGLNLVEVVELGIDEGYVLGAGNRVDVMIKAGEPGTYTFHGLDPSDPRSISSLASISPAPRNSRICADFPTFDSYPVPLATIVVSGEPEDMYLPTGKLPPPNGLPGIEVMKEANLSKNRNVAFEICSPGTENTLNEKLNDVCTYYFDRYDEKYWGGIFENLLMMRDADDIGIPNPMIAPPFHL